MKDRRAVIVYLEAGVRRHYERIAKREGLSLSAVCRRELTEASRRKPS